MAAFLLRPRRRPPRNGLEAQISLVRSASLHHHLIRTGGRDEYGNIIGDLRDSGPGNRNPLCVLRVAAVVQWTRRHDRRSASRRPLGMGTPEPAKQSMRELTRMGGMEPVRWGVLGTSKFAGEWIVPGMMKSPDVRVVAVGSRTRAKADSFAKALGIPMAYGSYDDLLNDPNVEAIYNPLPNHLHVPMTICGNASGQTCAVRKADCADRCRGGIAQDCSEGAACRRSVYGSTPSPMARSTKIDSRGKFGTDPHRPGLLLVLSRRPRRCQASARMGRWKLARYRRLPSCRLTIHFRVRTAARNCARRSRSTIQG